MVNINILGDFCVKDLNGLMISEELQGILNAGDINALNFEAPISVPNAKPILKSGPSLSQDPKAPRFLKDHKFNLFSLANNHAMDFGEDSLAKTMNAFGESATLGSGHWNEAYQYKVFIINGLRIAFLALTQYEFGVLGEERFDKYGTAWLCHPVVDELILAAKHENDYLIVLPHAGLEHFDYPLPELCTLYRHFINIGADAVIGNHPHVPQPCEQYKGRSIIYSLGNFVFDTLSPQNSWWYYGLMAQICVSKETINVNVQPISFDKEKRTVDCCKSDVLNNHLASINRVFGDTDAYIQTVNNHCLNLEFLYDYQFECSGYIRPNIRKYSKAIWHRFKEKITKKKIVEYNLAPYINNLRCEPHRWVMSRIYELKK